MKKYLIHAIIVLIGGCALVVQPVFATLDYPFGESETILTNEEGDVIGEDISGSTDPFRDGTKIVGRPIGDQDDGDQIYFDDGITTTSDAWTRGTRFVKGLMNWVLWIAGLVALIYLIYHGILALTAGTDDTRYQKGIDGVKYALFAIAGIAVAWFIVSLVFWLITLLTV